MAVTAKPIRPVDRSRRLLSSRLLEGHEMSRLDRSAEHELRTRLARSRESEIRDALAEARAGGQRDAERVVEKEMQRRGMDDG